MAYTNFIRKGRKIECDYDKVALTFSFLCNVLQTIVFPFALFILTSLLSVLRSTASDCPFGINNTSLALSIYLL